MACTTTVGLGAAQTLFLTSGSAIGDVKTLNTAVHEARAALTSFRPRHRLKQMHNFVKAPSMHAMALGHRLNGLGPIQLYDWVDGNCEPTALLG